MSTLIEEEVDEGVTEVPSAADWLDDHYPGWANKIDLDTFDMEDSRHCIGGQIGVHWWDLTQGWEAFSGLTDTGAFAAYTNEWRFQIGARQN